MPTLFRGQRGSTLTICAAVLAVLAMIAAASSNLGRRTRSHAGTRAAALMTPPSAAEVRLALVRVGLDPEALTACGLSAGQAAAVATDGKAEVAGAIGTIRSAEASLSAATATRDRLQELVRTGQAIEQDAADLAAAATAFDSALNSLSSALNGIFTAATADLSGDQRSLLQTVLSNRARRLPTQYTTVSRGEADWALLAAALDNKKVADRTSEDPDPDLATALATFDSAPSTSTAAANLGANLLAVTVAWDTAVGGS